jgi:hypothetical protein|nr:MAG TPA: hypothetical protein [Caudoviricetes sp.]
MSEKTKDIKTVKQFSKEQILESKKFRTRKDLLNVVLEERKKYTLEEVEIKIEEFMKKVVK